MREHSLLLESLLEDEPMTSYLERTAMDKPTVWATEVEICCMATMLQTAIYRFAAVGAVHKWLKFVPNGSDNVHTSEAIYLSNMSHHFQPVRRM